jgi:hypothetical protein
LFYCRLAAGGAPAACCSIFFFLLLDLLVVPAHPRQQTLEENLYIMKKSLISLGRHIKEPLLP